MSGAAAKWIGKLSPKGFGSKWGPRIVGLASMVFVAASVASACSAEDSRPSGPPLPAGGTGGGVPDAGEDAGVGTPCTTGDERTCHVVLGEHNGVLTCFDGIQKCVDGKWGYCTDGRTHNIVAPPGFPSAQQGDGTSQLVASITDASPCTNNPCDPTCQTYDELPDGGIAPDQVAPPLDWESGNINDLPGDIFEKTNKEPCSTAEECQMDQYCKNPTSSACSHHPCATGEALFSTCDPCVEKVCAADPTCCIPPYFGDCLHDPCAEGSALKSTCDPCAAAVCAVNKNCCTDQCTVGADCPSGVCLGGRCTCSVNTDCPNGWSSSGSKCSGGKCSAYWNDTFCVSQVPALCGKSCPALSEWTQSCVDKVSSVCGAQCNTDPPCAHDKCYTGSSLDAACDPCVAQICAIDPGCCTTAPPQCTTSSQCPSVAGWTRNCKNGKCVCDADDKCPAGSFCLGGRCQNYSWNTSCLDKVQSVCGEVCPPKGNCTPWLPTETDPNCPGIDLTVGVACQGTIPICNRGNTDAPAGIELVTYPANSGQFPKCNPPAGTVACTTTDPIPAGMCVSVSGCTGLVDGVELMVNPPGAAQVAECHCDNNWSIYQTAACQSPSCSGAASTSLIQKVSMYVAMDRSSSMRTSNPGAPPPTDTDRMATRWIPAANALKAFFADPNTAGLGVALRFWPTNDCDTNSHSGVCAPHPLAPGDACATPLVPLGTLTNQPAPTDAQEDALITQIDIKTNNPTDLYLGIVGYTPMYPALDGALDWAISRKTSFPDEKVIVALITDGAADGCNTSNTAMRLLADNAFTNYGVRTYVIGIADHNETQLNQIAVAGGGATFYMSEGTGIQSDLLAAMLAIKGDNISCNLALPDAGISDPSKVEVVYTPTAGMQTTLTQFPDASSCGDGWYFEDPMNPTSAKLCPSTCSTIQGDIGAKVQVDTPCLAAYNPFTYRQTYTGVCPEGTKVQWGYFTYNTTVPGDSYVKFSIRTADTEMGLPLAIPTLVATAQSVPDTQVCTLGGPAPCPIDLYNELNGLPAAQQDYLELEMYINPTSDSKAAPTVLDWNITYSCPPSE